MATKEKISFILYQSWEDGINLLTNEEKGKLLTNLFAYHKGEEVVIDTPMLQMCWNLIKFNLEENIKRYNTASENGSKGGAPKGNTNAKKKNDDLPKQPKTTKKQPRLNQNNLNDNDNDNDNDNVNVKEDVNVNVKQNNIADKLNTLKQNKVKGYELNFESFMKELESFKLSASDVFDLYNEY